jgi:phage baseplate assembly protein W
MSDAGLSWNTDLSISSTGDIALCSGSALGQQRVLRRLLTNPGDYIWHTDYGAGLAQLIGRPSTTTAIKSLVRAQIFREACVARLPEPAIDVQSTTGGLLYVNIRYVDSTSGTTQLLAFEMEA